MRAKLVVALALAVLVAPAVARADGDPASDWLPFGRNYVFAPDEGNIPPADVKRLTTVVDVARRKRFVTKVALIGTPDDLGSVTALWRKPQVYAQFLGKELFYLYKGRLLVVMPNGYGVSAGGGQPVPAEQALLRKLPVPARGLDNLPSAAIDALHTLATAAHVALPEPRAPAAKKSTTNRDRVKIIIAVAIAAAVVVAARFVRRPR